METFLFGDIAFIGFMIPGEVVYDYNKLLVALNKGLFYY